MSRKHRNGKKTMVQTPTPQTPGAPGAGSPQPASGGVLFPDRPQVVPLIQTIEKLRNSRVIAYYLDDTAAMANDAMPAFYEQLRAIGKQDAIDVWIHSHGGQTEVPLRIVEMVRAYCKRLGVLVTEVAQSAATHLALGADEILMGPFSVLSPVDPQRRHALLPMDKDGNPLPVSVQDLKHVVAFVNREAPEGGLSPEAYASVISALFDKVHPLALGAIEQSYALAKLVTKRMLATHMDEDKDAEVINKLADSLSDDYKSHQFPIGPMEAKRLGLKVVEAPDDLYAAMWGLMRYYDDNVDRSPKLMPKGTVFGPPSSPSGDIYRRPIGHLDSGEIRFDCVQIRSATGETGAKWIQLPNP